ncbi:MAG TPA: type VI secretion system contractile sheath large subunit, partial [Polyangiaceae bacterium]|nr:type VI secretion system contractile sheath large subunit [Polyangiaceae bacterium]
LLRLPYRDGPGAAGSFVYDESVDGNADMLWGSPVFAFAVRLGDSFARYRTATGLLGTFDDQPPVLDSHPTLGEDYDKPPVEVLLSRRMEHGLSELGLIPLTCDFIAHTLRFTTASSLQIPKTFGRHEGGEAATMNHLLGTRLPHLLMVSRFAHYLKVLERERIGGHRTRDEVERELNEWLSEYVNQMPNPSLITRLRFPLRAARVRTSDVEGAAGWYRMDIIIQPHLRYMGQAFTLSVAGRIDSR